MKRITLGLISALLLGLAAVASAQTVYSFQTVKYPKDNFIQLLGINNAGTIAGYHNFTLNQGFILTLPSTFTTANFPGSMQTQQIGINNKGETVGFYIDEAGNTHGFTDVNGKYTNVDFPKTTFNQLLGVNDSGDAAGYYQDAEGIFHAYIYHANGTFTSINNVSNAQATGVNNKDQVSGFYIDSANVTHGFFRANSAHGNTVTTLDYPEATSTMALGLNNLSQIVGTYTDASNNVHGFVYDVTNNTYEPVNDPSGVDSTIINGVNDMGEIVGFYGPSNATIGFVAKIVRCLP